MQLFNITAHNDSNVYLLFLQNNILFKNYIHKCYSIREFGIRKPLKKFWEWNIFSTFICDNQ